MYHDALLAFTSGEGRDQLVALLIRVLLVDKVQEMGVAMKFFRMRERCHSCEICCNE